MQDLKAREGQVSLLAAVEAAFGPLETPVKYTLMTMPGKAGRAVGAVEGCVSGAPTHWEYWPPVKDFLKDVFYALPAGVVFTFEWGDGARGWNSLGGNPHTVFHEFPEGFVSHASHRPSTANGTAFEMPLDPPAEALLGFLRDTCSLTAAESCATPFGIPPPANERRRHFKARSYLLSGEPGGGGLMR